MKALYVFFASLVLFAGVFFTADKPEAAAASESENPAASMSMTEEDVETRGLVAVVSLSISGGNGMITATAKNEFTLGNSTVRIRLLMYSSYDFQEYHSDMELVDEAIKSDLNIFKTFSLSVPTNGEQKFWMARMRYKVDDNDWQEKVTNCILYSAEGEELEFEIRK